VLETKHCGRCDTTKEMEAFSWKYESRGVRHLYCRECMRAYMREHYLRNKEIYKRRARLNNGRYIRKTRASCGSTCGPTRVSTAAKQTLLCWSLTIAIRGRRASTLAVYA
jgi:hypothetical protein